MPKNLPKKEFCLYHNSPKENFDNIMKLGFIHTYNLKNNLIKRGLLTSYEEEYMTDELDIECISFGQDKSTNYPTKLSGRKAVFFKVCFDEEEMNNFYPDEDYIYEREDFWNEDWRSDNWNKWSLSERDEWIKSLWKDSIETYGICYRGIVSPDHIVSYEFGIFL